MILASFCVSASNYFNGWVEVFISSSAWLVFHGTKLFFFLKYNKVIPEFTSNSDDVYMMIFKVFNTWWLIYIAAIWCKDGSGSDVDDNVLEEEVCRKNLDNALFLTCVSVTPSFCWDFTSFVLYFLFTTFTLWLNEN